MLTRLLAAKIVLSVLLLTGCATAPHVSPQFTTPDTGTIRRAIAVTAQKQVSVGQKIQKAATTARSVLDTCPQAKAMIDSLTADLQDAYADNQLAESSLQAAEGARGQLQGELAREIGQANQLANDYNKAGVQINMLKESRHGWVKRFWIATGACVLCLLWIFKKPLLGLTGIGI